LVVVAQVDLKEKGVILENPAKKVLLALKASQGLLVPQGLAEREENQEGLANLVHLDLEEGQETKDHQEWLE